MSTLFALICDAIAAGLEAHADTLRDGCSRQITCRCQAWTLRYAAIKMRDV